MMIIENLQHNKNIKKKIKASGIPISIDNCEKE